MRASTLVRPEQLTMPYGPDPQAYLDTAGRPRQRGSGTLHVAAAGPHYRELIDLCASEIIPYVR